MKLETFEKIKKMLHASRFKLRGRGFTIVELLIVIAIIALLVSLSTVLYSDSKRKSRDSRREEDMKEIQNALNLYVVNKHTYPICGSMVDIINPENNTFVKIDGGTDCLSQALVSDRLFPRTPMDPLGGSVGSCGSLADNVYCYASDGFRYYLRYSLETDSILGKSIGWQTVAVEP